METTISTNGKLLLTGEYFVLNGALALAAPTRYGQKFSIREQAVETGWFWESFDYNGQKWFEGQFDLNPLRTIRSSNTAVADRLLQIFTAIEELSGAPSKIVRGLHFQSFLEFPGNWGLGSSSTLIAALAQWAEVNPYNLLQKTFGGSGYDLACAISDNPLLYQIQSDQSKFIPVPFLPNFHEQLYFVFLNQKQNSREGIKRYRALVKPSVEDRKMVSQFSLNMLQAEDLPTFETVIEEHENFISKKLQLTKVKAERFADYWGAIKSLGAWGGDFVLATSDRSKEVTLAYFRDKGLKTIIPFVEMIKYPKAQ